MCVLMFESSHRPDGILTCFALVLAGGRCVHQRRHGDLLIVRHHWQYSLHCACSRSNFPSPPWETHVLLVFTGRRCLCLFRHRHNDVLLDHRQHSFWIGACSCGNFPSPRWDFHMFECLCLQGGGAYVYGGTVSFSSCTITGNTADYVRAHAQNFPSPRWENC